MKMAIIAGFGILAGLPIGPAQAGACTGEIANLTMMMAARDAGSGPTSGAAATAPSPRGTDAAQHPPTGRMSQETQGKAASPEDVRRQTGGQPTAAAQAQSGQSAGSSDKAAASAALERAKGFDQGGKEAECMEAVRDAKRLAGS